MAQLQYDELNDIPSPFESFEQLKAELSRVMEERDLDTLKDLIRDHLVDAYIYGVLRANTQLQVNIEPDIRLMERSINKRIADEDWLDRIVEYYYLFDVDGVSRVAETETTRNINQGMADTGALSGKPFLKRWETMRDNRVRETHSYLQGMAVGAEDYFYTFDGDKALIPGGFEKAENNCGCRCVLEFETIEE